MPCFTIEFLHYNYSRCFRFVKENRNVPQFAVQSDGTILTTYFPKDKAEAEKSGLLMVKVKVFNTNLIIICVFHSITEIYLTIFKSY